MAAVSHFDPILTRGSDPHSVPHRIAVRVARAVRWGGVWICEMRNLVPVPCGAPYTWAARCRSHDRARPRPSRNPSRGCDFHGMRNADANDMAPLRCGPGRGTRCGWPDHRPAAGRRCVRANEFVSIPIATGLGVVRNLVVVTLSDAVIAVGGRHETLSEIGLALRMGRHAVRSLMHVGSAHRLGGPRIHRARDPREAASLAVRLASEGPLESA